MTRRERNPELLGPTLDLDEPELAPIADRYVDRQVLVVGRPIEEMEPLRDQLVEQGWEVTTCVGPGKVKCPLMTGFQCEPREEADAAIVFMNPHAASSSALLPRLRCAAHGSPVVIVLEGAVDPPQLHGPRATVGAIRGPRAIAEALSSLRHDILRYGSTEGRR